MLLSALSKFDILAILTLATKNIHVHLHVTLHIFNQQVFRVIVGECVKDKILILYERLFLIKLEFEFLTFFVLW